MSAHGWEWLGYARDMCAAAIVASSAGRLSWHMVEAQKGRRRAFGLALLLEALIAIFMAVVAVGIGDYLGIGLLPTAGLASVLGWLGPRGIEFWAAAIIKRKKGPSDD